MADFLFYNGKPDYSYQGCLNIGFMLAVYIAGAAGIYFVESRQEHILDGATAKELLTTAILGIVCFCLSNLSYDLFEYAI